MPKVRTQNKVKRGGSRPYARGYALEQRVKAKLVALGWSVTRAGGSHGTDLVAARNPVFTNSGFGHDARRLVYLSVKRTGEIPPHERLDLAMEAKKAGAECYLIDGKYRVREVSDWQGSDWQELGEVF